MAAFVVDTLHYFRYGIGRACDFAGNRSAKDAHIVEPVPDGKCIVWRDVQLSRQFRGGQAFRGRDGPDVKIGSIVQDLKIGMRPDNPTGQVASALACGGIAESDTETGSVLAGRAGPGETGEDVAMAFGQ